jgi:S1-C subfamily serine protease
MTRSAGVIFTMILAAGLGPAVRVRAQQVIDPDFDAKVERPAFTDRHPAVLFDEAHNNYHTSSGRYRPFVALLQNDGYTVTPNKKKFTRELFQGSALLVISNAQGTGLTKSADAGNAAFEEAECDAVRQWVEAGGALLLCAKQHPWGSAAERLASKLGVEMGKSTTNDPPNVERGTLGPMVFSRDKEMLGEHPILLGRDASERVDRVLTYTGQSLQGPTGAAILLRLSATAVDRPPPGSSGRSGSAAGRAQGVAFTLGKGRVVVLGEAGLLSAQLFGPDRQPMGMNAPGSGNRQFALNIVHWLTGVRMRATGTGTTVAVKPAAPAPSRTPAPTPAPAPRPAEPGKPLSTADIAEQSEPSVALITGDDSTGTGFLVAPGLVMTNAHVIDEEYMPNVKVRFPSAQKDQQGPYSADLVYEDTRRDLALLAVRTTLPPLRIAPSYRFRKGEDIVVIGNPGAGGKLVLENAISRGIMSTKTALEGAPYYQLSIAVNPGNSGGPVFDSTGAVIGVLSRKSSQQEGLAYCVPVEDLHAALKKAAALTPTAIEKLRSRHRLVTAVKGLGVSGACYSLGISFRRRPTVGPQGKVIAKNKRGVQYLAGAIGELEKRHLPELRAEVAKVQGDPLVDAVHRDKVMGLLANLDRYKALYDNNGGSEGPGDPFPGLKATHRGLLNELFQSLSIERPEYMFVFNLVPAGTAKGANK